MSAAVKYVVTKPSFPAIASITAGENLDISKSQRNIFGQGEILGPCSDPAMRSMALRTWLSWGSHGSTGWFDRAGLAFSDQIVDKRGCPKCAIVS